MKYIIILGIQNSGSGAVHDYLAVEMNVSHRLVLMNLNYV